MTPEEVRARVDAIYPRVTPEGRVNPQHVAAEQTLRTRYGHPGFIPELDGPGRFLPTCPDCGHAWVHHVDEWPCDAMVETWNDSVLCGCPRAVPT